MSESRRRGGQPGNRNAVTHGFYADHELSGDSSGPGDEGPGFEGLQNEIDIVRKYLHRLDQLGDLYTDNLSAIFHIIRGLHLATNSIARLTRMHDQLAASHDKDEPLINLTRAINRSLALQGWGDEDPPPDPAKPDGKPEPPPPPYTPDPFSLNADSIAGEPSDHDHSF
jgi:hypothetical protein